MNATDRHVAYHHLPVMRDEIVAVFATVPAGTIVDATLGGGGHAAAILASRDDLSVLGVDRDQAALVAAAAHLAPFGDRVTFSHRRFDQLDQLDQVDEAEADPISGVLFDLGVSSPQLDRAERGFSYQHEGPLDMRMDATGPHSADDVVNTYEERTLAQVLRQYGDERFARRIAAAIVAARPIASTTELAGIITAAIPAPARRHGGHPAKRSFQAIRIEVNDELAALPVAIDQAIALTAPGGRVTVLTYHSGEDRIVKERFREASGACNCPPGLPCRCGAVARVRLVRGIPRSPSDAEVVRNRRAASARLRVVERLDTSDLDHDHDRHRDAGDDRPTHERGAR
ncbi:MAG: 16S rRNA (cytosine(1402)-N(4))-methyltransferase RsmH [Actinomycetota bacterium]|nr:16S rRNA (cytosine(1402)-N(4))-methyltransferase RsmH [Actinomycetota bacterium]